MQEEKPSVCPQSDRVLPVCLQASKQAEITKLQEEMTKVNLTVLSCCDRFPLEACSELMLSSVLMLFLCVCPAAVRQAEEEAGEVRRCRHGHRAQSSHPSIIKSCYERLFD